MQREWFYKKTHRHEATPLLLQLHWLPVRHRIQYKIACIVYRCLNGTAPIYLSELVTNYKPLMSLRSAADQTKLKPFRTKLKAGEKSFAFSGPETWNELPQTLRESKSIEIFKKNLKTFHYRLVCDSL